MRIIIVKNYEQLSEVAASLVEDTVKEKPNMSFCLPAGSSPIGMYQNLVADAKKGLVDFSKLRVCQMDEYVGLNREHNQSYYYFAQEHFLKHINYDEENNVVNKFDNIDNELSGLRKCTDENSNKIFDEVEKGFINANEQKRKHSCYLKILIIISVINLIIQLIQMFK